MRRLVMAGMLAAAALGLSACAGTGLMETASLPDGPLAQGKARLTVVRSSDLKNGSIPANVSVNDALVANLSPGGSMSLDIPAGPNRISVSTWSQQGQYAANLNAVAGSRYAVEVFTPDRNAPPGHPLGPLAVGLGATLADGGGLLHMRFIEPAQAQDVAGKVPLARNKSGS